MYYNFYASGDHKVHVKKNHYMCGKIAHIDLKYKFNFLWIVSILTFFLQYTLIQGYPN
jgi:hypothetical protein